MDNTIVWIYGASAAGKETFINKMIKEKPEKLIGELGWNGKEMVICKESVKWIGQYHQDPIVEKRKSIPTVVSDLLKDKNNAVVLIKGQDVDLESNTPVRLHELLPDCIHRILFLKTDIGELYIRGQRKVWWRPENSLETVKEWLNYQMGLLNKISDRLSITAVDSNSTDYHITRLPQELDTETSKS